MAPQQVQCTHSHMTSSEHNGHRTSGAISTTSVGGLGQWEMISEVPASCDHRDESLTMQGSCAVPTHAGSCEWPQERWCDVTAVASRQPLLNIIISWQTLQTNKG